MKTSIKHFVIAALLAGTAADARCRIIDVPVSQTRTISVSGSAEVKAAPDEVYLRVGVQTRNESLDDAKRENDERVSKSLSFLKTSGIRAKDIQTDFIGIEPVYDGPSSTRIVAYIVRRAIEIKITKVDAFEGLLTGLLDSGVNTVQGVTFGTSELRKYRDEARAMAIQAAKEKADAMASELGVKRGKVDDICASEFGGWFVGGSGYWQGPAGGGMFQNAIQNAGSSPVENGTLSAGQISISASVNVSFEIE
jgi:hypothetical protein